MRGLVILGFCLISLFGCTVSRTNAGELDCRERSIIVEIRKIPSVSIIDIAEDYFLLTPRTNEDTTGLSINDVIYDLHFLDLNAPQGAKNCCLQSGFYQNKSKEIELSDLYFRKGDIFKRQNASYAIKSGGFRLRYFVMGKTGYCTCSGNYSSTSQEVTETTAYLTSRPQVVKCRNYFDELEGLTSSILTLTEFAQ